MEWEKAKWSERGWRAHIDDEVPSDVKPGTDHWTDLTFHLAQAAPPPAAPPPAAPPPAAPPPRRWHKEIEKACACNIVAASGDVDITGGEVGCADHDQDGRVPWCYVQSPSACHLADTSQRYPGAAWRECVAPPLPPAPPPAPPLGISSSPSRSAQEFALTRAVAPTHERPPSMPRPPSRLGLGAGWRF